MQHSLQRLCDHFTGLGVWMSDVGRRCGTAKFNSFELLPLLMWIILMNVWLFFYFTIYCGPLEKIRSRFRLFNFLHFRISNHEMINSRVTETNVAVFLNNKQLARLFSLISKQNIREKVVSGVVTTGYPLCYGQNLIRLIMTSFFNCSIPFLKFTFEH